MVRCIDCSRLKILIVNLENGEEGKRLSLKERPRTIEELENLRIALKIMDCDVLTHCSLQDVEDFFKEGDCEQYLFYKSLMDEALGIC